MTKSFFTRSLLAVALTTGFLLTGCVQQKNEPAKAQTPSEGALESVQKIVQTSSNGQFKAVKVFEGPMGQTGVLLEAQNGGNKMIAWTNKEGTYLIPGPLFDKEGVNQAEKILAEQAGYITPEKLMGETAGQGFIAGKSGPIVTIFFEPYCGFCNMLFKEIEPQIEQGKLRARIIMVGFLRPDSVARAADIQFADNPYKALKAWENLKNKEKAKASTSTPEQQSTIQNWNALMNKAGPTGTPALLSCNKTSKQVEMTKGKPGDVKAFVENLGTEGSPACAQP